LHDPYIFQYLGCTTPNPGPSNDRHLLNQMNRNSPHPAIHKVLIADDHDIFRHGLKTLLNKYAFIKFNGEASNGHELQLLIQKEIPDIIFMDIHMPGGDGIEATKEILRIYPDIKIVMLSSYDDALMVDRMIKMGAIAYLTKTITLQLLDTLFEKIFNDEIFISPDAANNLMLGQLTTGSSPIMEKQTQWLVEEITFREKEVLGLLVKGSTQKQIAEELNLSPRTVETHKEKLMKRLGAKNIAEMISLAHQYKIV
jgi:DNA-binding NarL/FixJ family response regulator